MSDDDKILWGIHAGRMGDAERLFLSKNVFAIGWEEMRNCLSNAFGRESSRFEEA